MDQEIRHTHQSILKRQSTFDNPNYMEEKEKQHQQHQNNIQEDLHVHIDSSVKIITIPEVQDTQIIQEQNEIHFPKKVNNLSEAELIKLALKKPQIWEEDEQ
ncbi:unnamed protein product [Paramecium pentaurelia]|uniref:Uncharacterized protein n=1 Tax=Paramecium pentaurelia TaxID=43138 RepID=A0A8S1UQA7_9CILI|nr:unnamed protein product [Paramecium pentaurelia]